MNVDMILYLTAVNGKVTKQKVNPPLLCEPCYQNKASKAIKKSIYQI